MAITDSITDFMLGNYKTVSTRLGLVIEDGRIRGVVDGVPLQMWFGAHATHIGAILSRPAPIDVSIATKGVISKLGALFGGHTEGIGDAEFDKVFSVKASDVPKVASLLDPETRKALLESASEGFHPAVDAHLVHLRRFSQGGLADSEEKIEHDFHAAAKLSTLISNSFARAYR